MYIHQRISMCRRFQHFEIDSHQPSHVGSTNHQKDGINQIW